jgi:hypothetical protein
VQCWICHRQARGRRHADARFPLSDPRHHPMDWVFCSERCQNAFHAFYGVWCKGEPALEDDLTREALMIDATELERAAMRRCLRHFGEAAGEIGFDKALGNYSEDEALKVIDAVVSSYVDSMAQAHQNLRCSPVREAGKPLSAPHPAFADMADDIPWEEA